MKGIQEYREYVEESVVAEAEVSDYGCCDCVGDGIGDGVSGDVWVVVGEWGSE